MPVQAHNLHMRVDIFPASADNSCPISMAYVLYRDHTIVSTAVYDVETGKWKLSACISWQASGDHIYFLRDSPEEFSRVEEAEIAGLEHSKTWVDKKLSSSVLT
jgi:hypothetical protein